MLTTTVFRRTRRRRTSNQMALTVSMSTPSVELVEDQQIGVVDERPGEGQKALKATEELADGIVQWIELFPLGRPGPGAPWGLSLVASIGAEAPVLARAAEPRRERVSSLTTPMRLRTHFGQVAHVGSRGTR